MWKPVELPATGNLLAQTSADSESEDEDISDRPLSLTELKERTLNSILKKKEKKRPQQQSQMNVAALHELSTSIEALSNTAQQIGSSASMRATRSKPLFTVRQGASSKATDRTSTKGTLKRLSGLFNQLEVSDILPSVSPDGEKAATSQSVEETAEVKYAIGIQQQDSDDTA